MTKEEKNGFYEWMLLEFGYQDAQDYSGTLTALIAFEYAKFITATLTARVEELTRENEELKKEVAFERQAGFSRMQQVLKSSKKELEQENARLTERLKEAEVILKRCVSS